METRECSAVSATLEMSILLSRGSRTTHAEVGYDILCVARSESIEFFHCLEEAG